MLRDITYSSLDFVKVTWLFEDSGKGILQIEASVIYPLLLSLLLMSLLKLMLGDSKDTARSMSLSETLIKANGIDAT